MDKKTFNKLKKILKINDEDLQYNPKNIKELLYKYYKHEKQHGEGKFSTLISRENY